MINKFDSNLINFPEVCQLDNYNKLIKCIYIDSDDAYLKFLIINDMYQKVSDIKIEKYSTSNYAYAYTSFSFSANMVLIC